MNNLIKLYCNIVTLGLFGALSKRYNEAMKTISINERDLEYERSQRKSKECHLDKVIQENERLRTENRTQRVKMDALTDCQFELTYKLEERKIEQSKVNAFKTIEKLYPNLDIPEILLEIKNNLNEVNARRRTDAAKRFLNAVKDVKRKYEELNDILYDERKEG